MQEDLQQFGLSEKESAVYMASLEIGRATADQLSKHSGVNRSTTYVQIEELMKLGLMSTYEEGKKTYFLPESPEYLKRLFERQKQKIDEQEQRLEQVMPGLAQLFANAGERPRVRFFEGKEGLMTMREETLNTKQKELRVISSFEHVLNTFSKEERDEFSEKRINKKIKTKLLFTHDEVFEWKIPLTAARQIPRDLLPVEADIYIYDDSVALSSLSGAIVGVIIESPAIANSMRAIFEYAWSHSKEYTVSDS